MPRRPLHAAAGGLTAVHQLVELGAGTGVIGASRFGLPGAIAASVVLDGGWMALARSRFRAPRTLAFLSGIAVGVPAIHFVLWPWTKQRGVPWLTEAEGLPPRLMDPYNGILYAWAGAGLLALLLETPARHRRWAVAGATSVFLARPQIEAHFRWMAEEGKRHPAWWNRAWS